MRKYAFALFVISAFCLRIPHVSCNTYSVPCTSPSFDFALDTGYRWDKFYNRVALYGLDFGLRVSNQLEKGTNSYQLGAKLFWSICKDVYVRSSGHYGWIFSGDYEENTIAGEVTGNTWDVTAGLGYAFQLHPIWEVAPIIGWSYDKLDFKITHVIAGDTPVGNIDTPSRFQGPWGGFDIFLHLTPCLNLKLGYELHGASWKEEQVFTEGELSIGTSIGFSNERTHHTVWGNIFQIDARYFLSPCWTVGLGLKYQFWKGQNLGKYKRLFTPTDPAITNQYIYDLQWDSFSATLQLDYDF